MSAVSLTREEAHRFREGAVERRHAAREEVNALARTIASVDVRFAAIGRARQGVSTAEAVADELIIRQAAEYEAIADWHDAREICGLKPARS